MPELITGETEHHKTPVFEFVVERLQSLVLRRETTLTRYIDDEQCLATVVVHLLPLAVDGDEVDVVEVHGFRFNAPPSCALQFSSTFIENEDILLFLIG